MSILSLLGSTIGPHIYSAALLLSMGEYVICERLTNRYIYNELDMLTPVITKITRKNPFYKHKNMALNVINFGPPLITSLCKFRRRMRERRKKGLKK